MMCSHIPEESVSHSIVISFPALHILDFVGLDAIDCSTRVRPRQLFHNVPKLRFFRIAIWNKSRAVVTAAIVVWGINAAFSIQGRSLIPCTVAICN